MMRLYIASTSEYAGKTLFALSLSRLWGEGGVPVRYLKPLGKIPVMEEGKVVDEDASFLARELRLPAPPESVCPVVITQDIVMAAYRGENPGLRDRIRNAVREAASPGEVLLLGGAANLRDGIFLGLSPLDLVDDLDCRVLLLDRFSGEKSMDQILWAAGSLGGRLLGVVFNRVHPSQNGFLRETVVPFLCARGIRVFGAVPSEPLLLGVSVRTLAERLSAETVCGEEQMEAMIEQFCVGAMDADHALRVFRGIPRKAVVTGGHRADIQLAALETDTRCLVLTGGVGPAEQILSRAKENGVPVLVVQEDTLYTIDRFEDLLGRIRLREREKISRGVALVGAHVDVQGILSALLPEGNPGMSPGSPGGGGTEKGI